MAFPGTLEKDDPGRKIEPGEFEAVAVPYLYRTIDWNHSSRVSGPFIVLDGAGSGGKTRRIQTLL